MNTRPAARRSSLAGTSPVQPATTPPVTTPPGTSPAVTRPAVTEPVAAESAPAAKQPSPRKTPKATKATNAGNSGKTGGYRHKVSFYQERDQTDRVRGAILHTMAAEGGKTMSEFIAAAVMAEVERLEAKYNNGEPFPGLAAGQLPQGRPLGRGLSGEASAT